MGLINKSITFEDMVKLVVDNKSLQNKNFMKFSYNLTAKYSDLLMTNFNDYEEHSKSKELFDKMTEMYNEDNNRSFHLDISPDEKVKIYDMFQKYKDQIVFDLGAGISPRNNFDILNRIGIAGYIGVEPFNYQQGKYNLERDIVDFKNKNSFNKISPAEYVQSDILSLLKRIPDNSSSFIATGIDCCVIQDDKYFLECNRLISKKLHPEGVFISYASDFYRYESGYSKNITIDNYGAGFCNIAVVTKNPHSCPASVLYKLKMF